MCCPEAAAPAHWIVEGRSGRVGQPKCLSDSATMMPDSWLEDWGASFEVGVTCCDSNGVGTRPECWQRVGYETAKNNCKSKGLFLCTKTQIENGAGREKGCTFDDAMIWTSDVCEAGAGVLLGSILVLT